MPRWMLLLIGALCVGSLASVDPAAAMLLFDLEFLTVVGSAGVALVRGDARLVWERILSHHTVVSIRAGWSMTRERPVSLLQA